MKIMTLALIVFTVGMFLLFVMVGVLIHIETTPYKAKLPKHWEELNDGK